MEPEPVVFLNPAGASARVEGGSPEVEKKVLDFHRKLPAYGETPLHSLPQLAEELQLGRVFVKDESNRFGLPSFKILGASWAIFRAVVEKLGLDLDALPDDSSGQASTWQRLASEASDQGLSIVTCTEGNWGRAVAHMAKYFSMPVKIFVPSFMPDTTIARIRSEGPRTVVTRLDGNYDDAVAAAREEADASENAILVMDMGWDGYDKIPDWVVEGYSTMLREADAQIQAATGGGRATHALVPVGVGSIAHAVARHYKAAAPGHPSRALVAAVEPTTAAGLRASLGAGRVTAVDTGDSIMCGMNCGTVSAAAWPALAAGVDADVTVTDREAHEAVRELEGLGLRPGPCGAATLAALRRACRDARDELRLTRSSVVVLFCTEGRREYEVPR